MQEGLKILDIWVDPATRAEAIRRVSDMLRSGQRPHSVFASNPEKSFSVPRDPDLHKVFEQADLLLPDGIGIVWAARLLYGATLERVPGSEFIEDICRLAAREGYKIFLYGAEEKVNKESARVLQERYPGLLIAGRANGYLGADEMPDLIKRINDSGAEVLFLALGSPKQGKWYATNRKLLAHVKVVQGIGGTLDTIGGTAKRAPKIWCRFWAEWLYRLLTEPRRIRRQKVLPLFLIRVLGVKISRLLRSGESNP